MKNRTIHILLIAVAVMMTVMTSCKSTKKVTQTPEIPPPPPEVNHLTVKDIRNADFSTLSMNFGTEIDVVRVSGQVRIKKDKVIWVSISKIIELARVKMTTDSVYASVKVKNQAFQGTYTQFQKEFGIAINYDIMQALLIGNDIAGYQQTNAEYDLANSTTSITFAERKSSRQAIAIRHTMKIDNSSLKVLSHSMVSNNPSQNVRAEYSGFQSFGRVTLPTVADIDISATNAGRMAARLNYSKIQINTSLSYPISISSRAKPLSL